MGGSYVADSVKQLDGELTIPLADGANVVLHMSEVSQDFIFFIVLLFESIL